MASATKYFIEIQDRYYYITVSYLLDKLNNNNSVEMSDKNLTELSEDSRNMLFLQKVCPNFDIEYRIIRKAFITQLIDRIMENTYIEAFETLVTMERSHWLSMIFLFYLNQIDIAWVIKFLEESDITNRTTMLISELHSCVAISDAINPFDSWYTSVSDITGSVADRLTVSEGSTGKQAQTRKNPIIETYFNNNDVNLLNYNSRYRNKLSSYRNTPTTKIGGYLAKISKALGLGLEFKTNNISFAEYAVYERIFSTTDKFWLFMGFSYNWLGLCSIRDPYVKPWTVDIGFWTKVGYVLSKIAMSIAYVLSRIVYPPLIVVSYVAPFIYSTCLINAYVDIKLGHSIESYNAFVKMLSYNKLADPVKVQKQTLRTYAVGDFLKLFANKYFLEMAARMNYMTQTSYWQNQKPDVPKQLIYTSDGSPGGFDEFSNSYTF